MRKIDPTKKLPDRVIFDRSLNVQLGGRLFKVYYPELKVMRGVEYTWLLFSILYLK